MIASTKTIHLSINGIQKAFNINLDTTLLELIREHAHLTGTKRGCDNGHCGACTVLMNDKPVNSCCVLAIQADGADIVTIEGEGSLQKPSIIQQAFIDANAVQCGFCTPGMILSTRHLLENNHNPSDEDIIKALSGNLCRCTGYVNIIKAVHLAAVRLMEKDHEE
ncbi:MAG: (2Fe-2S)-binding protein [Clostridiales bacterium]|nr:(2Fe-2S)-binding protein [Clostridiales bacterium]MDD7433136.1 (2Fe-2S)-binding protein [Clostridiales bacterium]MDY3062013.1 (2Fe-2S)-binding protein [Eubacteriales bacterium]